MADIVVRKEKETPVARRMDPFDWMRGMWRWDPFQSMQPAWPAEMAEGFAPAFDVKETNGGYQFKADVPGVKLEDIEITLTGTRLSVTGTRKTEKEEKGDTYFTYERSFGSFTRSFTLPEGVDGDQVKADLKEGVLTILVPKRPEVQAKKIPVKA